MCPFFYYIDGVFSILFSASLLNLVSLTIEYSFDYSLATANATQSTQMRRHKAITQTILILFIVSQAANFVSGAPGAVREKLKGRVDPDGPVDGTTGLKKRVYPTEEGSTNMAGQTPPSPDRTEVDQLWQEIREPGMLVDTPTPLNIPGWSTSPFSETASTGSSLTPTPPTPLPEEHIPPAPSLTADTLSTTGHHPTLQQSSGPVLDVHPPPNTEPHPPVVAEMPIDNFLDMLMTGRTQRPKLRPPLYPEPRPLPAPMQPSPNLEPRPLPNPLQPPPNPEPHPPAATKIDKYSDMPMKGRIKRPTLQLPPKPEPRPLLSMIPPSNPEIHSLPNPVQLQRPPAAAEMPINDFLDMLMTGRTKRPKLQPPPRPPWKMLPPPKPNTGSRPLSTLMPPPPDREPRPLPKPMPMQAPLNPKPRPPAAADIPIDEFLDMLMRGKIRRAFPAPVL